MDSPEGRELYFPCIQLLRSLLPMFPSADNFSLFPIPEEAPPNVYAPPSGPFPPGVASMYPVFIAPESERHGERISHHSTPPGSDWQIEVIHAGPLNSYWTQQTHLSSMDSPEGRELYFACIQRELYFACIQLLRSLSPMFPSADNFSLFPTPEGEPPNVYAPPSGPFPPGVASIYPVFIAPESERHGERISHHSTPPGSDWQIEVIHAGPLNLYWTQQTHLSSMDSPESLELYFPCIEPLRSVPPMFPLADNFSLIPIPDGAPPNVCAHPSSSFLPGVDPMYPVLIAPESERNGERDSHHFITPGSQWQTEVSHAGPVNSYRTQQTHISSMDLPESREVDFADIKPLRSLAPVFPSADNFSSVPIPEGTPPNVYAPTSGPFPPGVAPMHPVFIAPEPERQGERNSHHFTPPGSQRETDRKPTTSLVDI